MQQGTQHIVNTGYGLVKDRSVGQGEQSPFPFYFNMLSSYTYSMYAPQEIS